MMKPAHVCQLVLMGLGLVGLSACQDHPVPLEAAPTPTPSCYTVVTVHRAPIAIRGIDSPARATSNQPISLVTHFSAGFGDTYSELPETAAFEAAIDSVAKTVTVTGTMEGRTVEFHGRCLFGGLSGSSEATASLPITLSTGTYTVRFASSTVDGGWATSSLSVE